MTAEPDNTVGEISSPSGRVELVRESLELGDERPCLGEDVSLNRLDGLLDLGLVGLEPRPLLAIDNHERLDEDLDRACRRDERPGPLADVRWLLPFEKSGVDLGVVLGGSRRPGCLRFQQSQKELALPVADLLALGLERVPLLVGRQDCVCLWCCHGLSWWVLARWADCSIVPLNVAPRTNRQGCRWRSPRVSSSCRSARPARRTGAVRSRQG